MVIIGKFTQLKMCMHLNWKWERKFKRFPCIYLFIYLRCQYGQNVWKSSKFSDSVSVPVHMNILSWTIPILTHHLRLSFSTVNQSERNLSEYSRALIGWSSKLRVVESSVLFEQNFEMRTSELSLNFVKHVSVSDLGHKKLTVFLLNSWTINSKFPTLHCRYTTHPYI